MNSIHYETAKSIQGVQEAGCSRQKQKKAEKEELTCLQEEASTAKNQ